MRIAVLVKQIPKFEEMQLGGAASPRFSAIQAIAADFIHQGLAGEHMRLAAVAPLAQEGFDAGSSRAYQPFRAAIEQPLLRLAGILPSVGDMVVKIAFRTGGEAAVDQPQRMPDARQPRHRLGISRRGFGLALRDQAKHPTGLSPAELTKV